jgi:hypothetical protein
MGQGWFSIERKVDVEESSASVLLTRLHADAKQQLDSKREEYRWLVEEIERWRALQAALGDASRIVSLESWLTDKERIRLFLAALDRIEPQEPSISAVVFKSLRTLVATS